MNEPIELHGCWVQCMCCWIGAHSKCDNPACQCQGGKASDRMVQRLHEAQRYTPHPGNRNHEPRFRESGEAY